MIMIKFEKSLQAQRESIFLCPSLELRQIVYNILLVLVVHFKLTTSKEVNLSTTKIMLPVFDARWVSCLYRCINELDEFIGRLLR